MKVLANDGIAASGKTALENAGFEVITETVSQSDLVDVINREKYEVLLVRSATKVRKDIIDNCPSLKMIGRGGVGMDNIDVEYARSKGIEVFNTPASSSQSVAELVMAHLFGAVRFLYDANREMPTKGNSDFKVLKKKYAKGIELRGKTIGIYGFGRIGQALASYALGCGMHVMAHNLQGDSFDIEVEVGGQKVVVEIENHSLDEVLSNSDIISMHVPSTDQYLIGKSELEKMKDGAILINAARGGVIDEKVALEALDSGKLAHLALDVFEGEPEPSSAVLQHEKVSLSPHIGAATLEAQDRIGTELADNIIAHYKIEV
ncbi:MAG: 3-phosphoglycerate dehydrogenase [Flavobacteriales bacterium]|nr:3-phosphoglycerate dehydrogenase [Flavobacteriales bacterium]|tara:strand:+ start:54347 stop:55303 length:957 start_codon:yes stop_codon:yes gene_type:complete